MRVEESANLAHERPRFSVDAEAGYTPCEDTPCVLRFLSLRLSTIYIPDGYRYGSRQLHSSSLGAQGTQQQLAHVTPTSPNAFSVE